ncbi:unnamed protein product [Peronospora destructor]|uniref:WH2 domain-containing protein n=1 Tax=Peronospora destructor TaxID=86335 RepID=A0AAV0U065_9STRA|nr:unnamed protein product [Peronospora destructor]
MDPVELKEKLQNLERQVATNPTDGPTRKRKQELEDTLRVVVKRAKGGGMKKNVKSWRMRHAVPMSITKLTEANREKFQNPERSIYYHPTLNPFGAPPPGKPTNVLQCVVRTSGSTSRFSSWVFETGTSTAAEISRPTASSKPRTTPSPARMQQPRMMARRPGKRPPLPLGPPPPGTIQVPSRPPLPSGTIPARPPPPPPVHNSDCCVEYLPPPSASVARVSSAPSVPVSCRPPAPVPRPTMPSIDVLPGPPPRPTNLASNSSLSNEFNTFMEEVKDLLD